MKREIRRWVDDHLPNEDQQQLEPVMTIGEAARATGLSESALRKYESAGLILYHRSSGNVRVLSREDLDRIRCIQHLIKGEGLNLEGIRRLWSLFPCWECVGCSAQQQEACGVLRSNNQPCWMVMQRSGQGDVETCRQCKVYRLSASCTEQLKYIVHNAGSPAMPIRPCHESEPDREALEAAL